MRSFLFSIFLTQSLLWVVELLTIFLVIFYLIYLANAMIIISNHKFINLIIWLSSLWVISSMCSLLWILMSRTTSPLPYLISIFGINPSPRLYTILLTLQVLKSNYLLLDVVSTRLPIPLVFPKLLLSQI